MTPRLHDRWQRRAEVRRGDWASNGLVSGFVATFAMTGLFAVAYGLAGVLGDPAGGALAQWFWALAHNPMTAMSRDSLVPAIGLNLLMGLLLGLLYGRFAEPMLAGRGWRKGVLFALMPWAISVVALLPALGGGFLGLMLGAGPLPILGNLILHLVYGAVLGSVYAIALDAGTAGTESDRVAGGAAQRGAAIGIGAGGLVGFAAGWLLAPQLAGVAAVDLVALAGALVGAAAGLAAGSLVGLGGIRLPKPSPERIG